LFPWRGFPAKFTLEAAIGSHNCYLQASMRVKIASLSGVRGTTGGFTHRDINRDIKPNHEVCHHLAEWAGPGPGSLRSSPTCIKPNHEFCHTH
jgi:hypothetical protein